ncbi:adenylate/guanylate cyclase domain-containing protein [Paeniglutamicibacter cryotolerans]|uniref:Adenylate cyclase n=1 Tax=Paeniglutamicibacter cryotolerans TaxID=670079 RepID=A0A839QVK2_9MICC|nr:adenylate/guanylate cyclase domain-containing protein [Paeniglutamicibacter cryotolerans]MBB2996031.1 adenylate cyclase [Paeniglutamicibacter cryotolerans]
MGPNMDDRQLATGSQPLAPTAASVAARAGAQRPAADEPLPFADESGRQAQADPHGNADAEPSTAEVAPDATGEPGEPNGPGEATESQEPDPASTPLSSRDAARALERRLLGAERTMRRREVAQGAGVSLLSARKLWRAIGFPNLGDEEVFFTAVDQEALLTMVGMVREGTLTEETAISLTRSIGQMTDRMVVWQVEALVEDMVQNQGMSDPEARRQLVHLLPDLLEPLEELLVYSWRRQMNAAVHRLVLRAESGLAASAEGRDGSEDDAPLPLARAVGFADLVSYTSLSRRMNERTLAQLVQRFENKCAEVISVGGGRLVKTIGDEVLFIAETPQAGAQISLALAREFREDEFLPDTRVSLVWGRVLSRLGDIYGPTVNLAARLTSLAEPGTVLIDSLTAATLADDDRFVLEPMETTSVRGFGDINPVRLAPGKGEGLVLD